MLSLNIFLLILDSLGSTELLFILAIALIFFGPRKLPQISRSLGKGLAEFRKASEDFKQTWEREVALENANSESELTSATGAEENSIMPPDLTNAYQTPIGEVVPAERVIPRQTNPIPTEVSVDASDTTNEVFGTEASRKQDWL
jgi:TatA/E family protein of Tat protein translocase